MARRIAIIAVVGLAALLLLAAGGLLFTLKTQAGRTMLAGYAGGAIGSALGGEAKIGAAEGDWPQRIVLRDVVLSDHGEPWLRADRITLVWNPWALVTRKTISVRDLDVGKVDFLRAPPEKPQTDEKPKTDDGGFDLPDFVIDRIALGDLKIGAFLLGRETAIGGTASARNTNGRFSLTADLASADANDLLAADIVYNRRRNQLEARASGNFAASGIVAALAGLDGDGRFEIEGDGPADNWKGRLALEAGAYGSANLSVTGNLQAFNRCTVSGTLYPGPAAPDDVRRELGDEIAVDVSVQQRKKTIAANPIRIAARPGVLSGVLRITPDQNGLRDAEADLRLDIADGWRTDLRPYLGNAVVVSARANAAKRKGAQGYKIAGAIEAGPFDLQVDDGFLAPGARAEAGVALNANEAASQLPIAKDNPALAQLLDGGAKITAALDADFQGAIKAHDIDAIFGRNAGRLTGEAAYDPHTDNLTANVNARAASRVLAGLSEGYAPTGPVTLDASLDGPLDALAVEAKMSAPAAIWSKRKIPATTWTATLKGVPSRPDGRLAARSADGAFTADADLGRDEQGRIAVRRLDVVAPKLTAHGSGAFSPDPLQVSGDLDFKAEQGAWLLPSLPVSGTLTAHGDARLSKGGTANITLKAADFSLAGVSIDRLDAAAQGPADAVRVKIDGENIAAQGAPPLDSLAAEALVSAAAKTIRIRMESLAAASGPERLRLLSPADITLDGDTVTLAGFDARISGARLKADGVYSPKRWRASIDAAAIEPPNAPVAVDLALSLDTDAPEAAHGTAVVRRIGADTEDPYLNAAFSWNGAALNVGADLKAPSGGYDDILKLSIPLKLTRGEALGVAVDGDLTGRVAYRGAVSNIVALLDLPDQEASGELDLSASIAGPVEAPHVDGALTLAKGQYEQTRYGLIFRNLSANATFAGAADGFTAKLALNGDGADGSNGKRIALNADAAIGKASRIDAALKLDKAKIVSGKDVSATASADLTLNGSFDDLRAAGDIFINQLDAEIPKVESTPDFIPVDVVAVNGDTAGDPAQLLQEQERKPPDSAFLNNLHLALKLKADDKVFIRGRGLESEWSVNMYAYGTAAEPLLDGGATIRRGTFEFAGRQFKLTEGSILFDRLHDLDPSLSMKAEYSANDITAIVAITGRATAPSVSLSSTPSKPSEDILALVLFGKSASQLTALESVQVAQALASLGGVGPLGGASVFDRARRLVGLDLLSVNFDQENAQESALTIGKYVANGVFVSATQDLNGKSGAVAVTFEVTDNISIEAQAAQTGDQSLSADWKWDY